jgi:hypothetical protein
LFLLSELLLHAANIVAAASIDAMITFFILHN